MLRRSTHVLTSLPHKTGQQARIQECNWGRQHLAHKQLPRSPAPLYNFTKRRLNRNGKKKIPSFRVAFSGCINRTFSWPWSLRFLPLARKPMARGSAQWVNPRQLMYNLLILAGGDLELRPPKWWMQSSPKGWKAKMRSIYYWDENMSTVSNKGRACHVAQCGCFKRNTSA